MKFWRKSEGGGEEGVISGLKKFISILLVSKTKMLVTRIGQKFGNIWYFLIIFGHVLFIFLSHEFWSLIFGKICNIFSIKRGWGVGFKGRSELLGKFIHFGE